ncbi:MAG: PspC domain-containing protein [Candidatus Jorgensenbacteria bacterium]
MEKRAKKLYRSETDKVFAGVIGGLGEYFGVDPVVLRLAWIAIAVFTGIIPGIVVYILAFLVVPRAHSENV